MVFHSFLLTSYGIQVITGSENFTSKRHLLQVLTWLLALTILVTRTADRKVLARRPSSRPMDAHFWKKHKENSPNLSYVYGKT